MSKYKDITGNFYGQWKVLEYAGRSKHGDTLWRVRCACGKEVIRRGASLRYGKSRQCQGCATRKTGAMHGCCRGGKVTAEYLAWRNMRKRCADPSYRAYSHYGGRGIVVCDRWKDSFEMFLRDMGSRPLGRSLDRIDNEGDYEPGNCRWANRQQQMNNKRTNRLLEHEGQVRTMAEWSRVKGLKYQTLQDRLKRGWSVAKTLNTPV